MFKNTFLISAALALASCGASGFKKNSNSPKSAEHWDLQFNYVAPAQEGGLWSRTVVVKGPDHADIPVDKEKDNSQNWVEVGFTNDKGEFYDPDSTGTVRYRIGGIQISDWVGEQRDMIISKNDPSRSGYVGPRCIIRQGVVVSLEAGSLSLKCDQLIVNGTLRSFSRPFPNWNLQAKSAGKLTIVAKRVEVRGTINMSGQNGYHAGNGGTVDITYDELLSAPDSIRADAGNTPPQPPTGIWHATPGLRGIVTLRQRVNGVVQP